MTTRASRILLVYNADWSLRGGLDYADDAMASAAGGEHPCVLAEVDGRFVRVVGAQALGECRDAPEKVDCLERVLRDALAAADLTVE